MHHPSPSLASKGTQVKKLKSRARYCLLTQGTFTREIPVNWKVVFQLATNVEECLELNLVHILQAQSIQNQM